MLNRRTFLSGLSATLPVLGQAGSVQVPLFTNGKEPAITLYAGEQWDKPFLYPIRTISGRTLSRGWPLSPQPGDSTDHSWHRGFWYGHGIINGGDYWRELGRDKTARLVLEAPPKAKRNQVSLQLRLQPPAGPSIGSVAMEFQVRDRKSGKGTGGGTGEEPRMATIRELDARIVLRASAGLPLRFGDTDDGGFAFRLREEFREDRGAKLRNANGQSGTRQIWGKASRWVDYATTLEGAQVGVALLDHPKNLRHPSQWHARGYGLNSANPFARRSFDKAAPESGDFELPAGQTLTLRYRALLYEGSVDLDAEWAAFAEPR